MVNLLVFEQFWQHIAHELWEHPRIEFVVSEQDMAKKISQMARSGQATLFVVIPESRDKSVNADNRREEMITVIFIMDKYDAQRPENNAYATLRRLQPDVERLKDLLWEEDSRPCSAIGHIDARSMSTIPVSEMFNNTAGWSVAFSFS